MDMLSKHHSGNVKFTNNLVHFNQTKISRVPSVKWGFPGISAGEESASNTEDTGSIPRSGRFPGEGNGYPL